MATTTRLAMLELLSEALHDWWSQVTTSAGSTTTIVDTKLAQISADDDFCEGWWVRNVSTGVKRLVTSYDSGTTTITHVAMPVAVANGASYELHRIDPDQKHNALNRAVVLAYGKSSLYLPLRDETLVVDQLLSNWDFESALSDNEHPSWARANHTAALETTRVWHGSNSADITATSDNATLSQDLFSSVNIDDVAGKVLRFEGRIWSKNLSDAFLRVTFDGSTYTSSSYHAGSSEWEGPRTQYVSVNIPTDATEMTCFCWVETSGQTAYFDSLVAWIDPIHKHTIPTTFVRGPHWVKQQYNRDRAIEPYYILSPGEAPISGRILRLEGMGLLSRPTTDAGTFEIGEPQNELLIAYAMRWLTEGDWLQGGAYQRGRQQDELAFWNAKIAEYEADPAMRMPKLNAEDRKAWQTAEDSSGKYLIFKAARG